ncbi:MAG: ribonuclease III [Clostridiales bacterium]
METHDIVAGLGLDRLAGIRIQDALIDQAFRHPSYCMENPVASDGDPYLDSNQRLEFLGDAVLGFLTAQKLYLDNVQAQEGELTKLRASLVCEKSLAAAASVMGLGQHLKLGKGIAAAGGAGQPSVLADAFEALLGALYLCGATLPALEDFVFRSLEASRHLITDDVDEDYKGQLQAWVQKTNDRKLSYEILEEKGPDHRKLFLAAAYLDGKEIGRGWGNTKQEAQKQAAKLSLRRLTKTESKTLSQTPSRTKEAKQPQQPQ